MNLEWDQETANAWPASKEQTVFGQVPHLVHGELQVSQSMAIVRYLSRKTGLEGDSDEDYAVSEMLLEEFNDLYTILAKVRYGVMLVNFEWAYQSMWRSRPNALLLKCAQLVYKHFQNAS